MTLAAVQGPFTSKNAGQFVLVSKQIVFKLLYIHNSLSYLSSHSPNAKYPAASPTLKKEANEISFTKLKVTSASACKQHMRRCTCDDRPPRPAHPVCAPVTTTSTASDTASQHHPPPPASSPSRDRHRAYRERSGPFQWRITGDGRGGPSHRHRPSQAVTAALRPPLQAVSDDGVTPTVRHRYSTLSPSPPAGPRCRVAVPQIVCASCATSRLGSFRRP